jgi:hypothetical protein
VVCAWLLAAMEVEAYFAAPFGIPSEAPEAKFD